MTSALQSTLEALQATVSSQDPGLFSLAGSSDNLQHLTSQQTSPNRLVGPGISITIPHVEENRRCPTPALLPALGMESHTVVLFTTAKSSFPWSGLPPGLGQTPRSVSGAASKFTVWNCTSYTLTSGIEIRALLHLFWPLMGNSKVGATPTSLLNMCQAPLNQFRHFNHSQETFQIVL